MCIWPSIWFEPLHLLMLSRCWISIPNSWNLILSMYAFHAQISMELLCIFIWLEHMEFWLDLCMPLCAVWNRVDNFNLSKIFCNKTSINELSLKYRIQLMEEKFGFLNINFEDLVPEILKSMFWDVLPILVWIYA